MKMIWDTFTAKKCNPLVDYLDDIDCTFNVYLLRLRYMINFRRPQNDFHYINHNTHINMFAEFNPHATH